MFDRICIVGVGMIGGSVARAARANQQCRSVTGFGRHEIGLKRAVELGVIDDYQMDLVAAAKDADLVVLCSPVGAFESLFKTLQPIWSNNTLYTDVGSTKGSVLEAVRNVFGSVPSNFVPAHPIAGSENNGVEASRVDLLHQRRVILTPDEQTDEAMLTACRAFWQALGAEVSSMSVDHHDTVLAATSHLPHVLAFALVELLRSKEDEQELFKYAAGGFKDFTRIASSSPNMWADICMANADKIMRLLDDYKKSMDDIGQCLQAKDRARLLGFFEDANDARRQYLDQLK